MLKSPFPQFNKPTPEETRQVRDALALHHGEPKRKALASLTEDVPPDVGCDLGPRATVLDSLVRTILSQNTTDITSSRAFRQLKDRLPDWSSVRTAPSEVIEEAIRIGGLAQVKTARIKAILDTLHQRHGSCSLEHLRSLSTEEIKQELLQFKGVGKKTISCVLMFCLNRHEFPVDTHVWEISKRLGWIPQTASRDQTYDHLNSIVPDEIKYDLHVLLVQHGKLCSSCFKTPRASSNSAAPCPLAPFKQRSKGTGDAGQASGKSKSKKSKSSAETAAPEPGTEEEVEAKTPATTPVTAHVSTTTTTSGGSRRKQCVPAAAVKQEVSSTEDAAGHAGARDTEAMDGVQPGHTAAGGNNKRQRMQPKQEQPIKLEEVVSAHLKQEQKQDLQGDDQEQAAAAGAGAGAGQAIMVKAEPKEECADEQHDAAVQDPASATAVNVVTDSNSKNNGRKRKASRLAVDGAGEIKQDALVAVAQGTRRSKRLHPA